MVRTYMASMSIASEGLGCDVPGIVGRVVNPVTLFELVSLIQHGADYLKATYGIVLVSRPAMAKLRVPWHTNHR
jgi:hypothetical protein